MVEIQCLVCNKPMRSVSCTNFEDYDGQLFCRKCNLLWDVKLKSSKLFKYKLAKQLPKDTETLDVESVKRIMEEATKREIEVRGLTNGQLLERAKMIEGSYTRVKDNAVQEQGKRPALAQAKDEGSETNSLPEGSEKAGLGS